ncbi:bifunctional 2-polyprenyl-6-hydroxyphenol methylase/3-demethylubiquinol 3-O-methyltransferase UbiG [Roseiflexus sp.]|uniref:class I SAM-dependent methyltransferase n=1 Tax=Roseiflexus sp. TaxID=2562120 RepID=UPI0021DE349A|nr:class I SAM-dependent methyltransferase [Roseiflexus sp.]GIW02457.1 MAG: type 11 methyltransferase [Roseiflexus sp.]
MSLQTNKRQWEDIGQLDPFWGMTGTNRFDGWNIEAFLNTGHEQVSQLLRQIEPCKRPEQWSTVLDFGCGVGRLAPAWRTHFEHYIGIDIAESLIVKARQLHTNLSKVDFVVSASTTLPIASNSCDMVYAWGVLQHVPNQTIALCYVADFVRVMRPGGLLVFTTLDSIHPVYRLQPRRRAYALLRTVGVPAVILYHHLRLYPHEVHPLPGQHVIARLKATGARALQCDESPSNAPHRWRTYYVTK